MTIIEDQTKADTNFEELTSAERKEIDMWKNILCDWRVYRSNISNKAEADTGYIEVCNKKYPGLKLNIRTLYRKWNALNSQGEAALTDRRGKHGNHNRKLSGEIWDIFEYFYLDQSQKSVQLCITLTRLELEKQGIYNPEMPSSSTFTREVRKIPIPYTKWFRDGEKAFTGECAPYIKRMYDDLEPNDIWVADNHTFDIILHDGNKNLRLYLEDHFRVHWWTPYEEHVPRFNNLTLPLNISESGKPAFGYRDMHTNIEKNRMGAGWGKIYDYKYGKASLFYTRNRLNGTFAPATAKYGGMDAFGAPYTTHTMGIYFPSYTFSSHPEYFAMVGGVRVPNGQLCMTNEDLIRDMTASVKECILISNEAADAWGQPRPKYYSLSTNDTAGFCQYPVCAAMEAQKGLTGVLLNFVNRVAEGIKDDYPDVKIETLAYWHTVEIPKDNTKPAGNVIVRLADNYMDILHGLDHPNNANVLRRLKAWSNFVGEGQLFIWDYGINLEINPPMPTMFGYADRLRKYLEYGATGYFVELQNSLTTDFWDMKVWMITKLIENPYLDTEALADTFLNGYYGSAAQHIKKYLQMMLETVNKSGVSVQYGTNIFNSNYVTLDNVIKGLGYFKDALESVTDPVIMTRINFARVSLDKIIANRREVFVATAKSQGIYDDKIKELIDGIAAAQRVIECLNQQLELKNVDGFEPANVRLAERQIEVFRGDY